MATGTQKKVPTKVPTSESTTQRKVPTYCYQCVAGPDLLNVVVEDGVAVKVEPNFGVKEHPAGGRPCVRAYSLVQKLYNPNRVKGPMKRTASVIAAVVMLAVFISSLVFLLAHTAERAAPPGVSPRAASEATAA